MFIEIKELYFKYEDSRCRILNAFIVQLATYQLRFLCIFSNKVPNNKIRTKKVIRFVQ